MQNLIKFRRFVHKIMSVNELLEITKGHNCVVNCENGLVTISTQIWLRSIHMQNLIKFYQFVHMILSGNKILTLTKGNNSVVNLRK